MSLFNRSDKSGEPPASQPKADAPSPSSASAPALNLAAPKPAAPKPAEQPAIFKPAPTPQNTGASMASVISKALKIKGELESTEDIQIDGQIEGDVRGTAVKIGQNAKVKGTVYAEAVELAGTIEGRIESKGVVLTGTARMTGDICHQEIKIETGAYVAGSLKPDFGKSEVKPIPKLEVASSNAAPGLSSATGANVTGTAHH